MNFLVKIIVPAEVLGDLLKGVTPISTNFTVESEPVKVARSTPKRVVGKENGQRFSEKSLLAELPTGREIDAVEAADLYAKLGYNPSGTSSILSSLVKSGKVEHVRRGIYRRIG